MATVNIGCQRPAVRPKDARVVNDVTSEKKPDELVRLELTKI